MSAGENLNQILENATTVCYDGHHFHIEWQSGFKKQIATIVASEVEAEQAGLIEAAELMNRAHGRHVLASWKTLILNKTFLSNRLVLETKVGAQIYMHGLETVNIVNNVVQLVGSFYQLKKHQPRDKKTPSVFYLIDDVKKLSRSLSVTRAHLEKQFPGMELRRAAALSLDIPLSDVRDQLFMRPVTTTVDLNDLPADYSAC